MLQKKLWSDFVFGKQTIRELSRDHKKDKRIIKRFLKEYAPPKKTHRPREVNLVVDATYFGERKKRRNWCIVVFRDPKRRENLWWKCTKTETTSVYLEGRRHLERFGYTILSVTGDGFGGIRQAFSDIPFQMCHVHMERLVIKGTTRNPQTEAGKVLLALVRILKYTEEATSRKRLTSFVGKYRTFLSEKTIHPLSGERSFTHEGVRYALNSLMRFVPYLFTFKKDKRISRTTNSLEGCFSHINRVTSVHRGLSRSQKEKVLHSICLASSVAPSERKMKNIV